MYSHEDSVSDMQKSDSDKMALSEIINCWRERLANPEDQEIPYEADICEETVDDFMDKAPNEEAEEEEEHEEIDTPQLLAYRDFVFKASAYEWLLASLHKEYLLIPTEPNSMEAIRHKIISFLPSAHKVSRRKSPDVCKIIFVIDWDPLAFVDEQAYKEEPNEAVAEAITLTGSAKNAQALTCSQYLCQTWPLAGVHTIRLVKDVVRSGPGRRHTCMFASLHGLF